METQARLSRHDKFISVENITILSDSSDDYLHAFRRRVANVELQFVFRRQNKGIKK